MLFPYRLFGVAMAADAYADASMSTCGACLATYADDGVSACTVVPAAVTTAAQTVPVMSNAAVRVEFMMGSMGCCPGVDSAGRTGRSTRTAHSGHFYANGTGSGSRATGSGRLATDSRKPTRRCTTRNGAGAHQLYRPSRCINAGNNNIRTRVASASTASVTPRPNITITDTCAAISVAKDRAINSAAAVTTRPVLAIPRATASSLSTPPDSSQYSRMREIRNTS